MTSKPLIDPERYCTAQEAALLLGGIHTPHTLRKMARQGRIRGAIKTGHHVLLLRASLRELVTDLYTEPTVLEAPHTETERPLTWHDRRAHVTLDGYVESA